MTTRVLFVFLSATLLVPAAAAQSVGGRGVPQEEGFIFQTVAEVRTTPVKDQARTGTCWSFATTSFIETELLRMGNGLLDLSDMYFVRMTYPQKVQNYVRLHGNTTLGQGSLAGDVIRAVRLYGAVPEALYSGRRYGKPRHDHTELHAVVKAAVDALVKTRGWLSPVWPEAVEGILDAYLGEIPETFVYNGKTYTPRSFADELGISPDDYVELTSFTHHPFDSWFALEIPDNWARNESYNVPLEELMGVIDRAIERGFSVDWDGDVSERSFCHDKGVAVWPLNPWDERSSEERGQLCDIPEPEVRVTQELRQRSFDNYTSSDDHLMHIVGIAKDQHGTKYYITKNSWGETGAKDGLVYMSESYVRAKTMSILVHRDALPQEVARRALRN